MARQCPCASNAGSSIGRDEDSSAVARSALVLRRWSTIRCFKIPTSQCAHSTVLRTSPSRVEPRETSPAPARRRVPAHGREVMHSDRGNRRGNPPSFPARLGVGKRRGRSFRLLSVRDVGFARRISRSRPRFITRAHSESCSGDRTGVCWFSGNGTNGVAL